MILLSLKQKTRRSDPRVETGWKAREKVLKLLDRNENAKVILIKMKF